MQSQRGGTTPTDQRDEGGAVLGVPPLVGGFAALLRAKLRAILIVAVAVLAAVMVAWVLWPARYTAVALVALDPQTPRLTTDRDSQLPTGDASAVLSLAEVATSDGFLVALAQQQKLGSDPEFTDIGDGITGIAADLRRNLKVTRRGLSYLIDISFTAKSPETAARIANAVAAEIVQRQQALRKDASGGISEALRSRLADLRAAVLASEKAVADYRQANELIETGPEGALGLKRLNSLTEQLGPLRARLEDARARFDKLRKAKAEEDADPSIFKSDRLTELLTRLGDEKRTLAAAERTFGPRHPGVEAAQAKIASIQDAVKSERARIVEQAKAEVDVLTEQNAAYEKEIVKRTREQLASEQKQVVLQDLVRQAQADRQIYEQFLARQKTTQEQSDLTQPEAVVVSTAEPPTKSSRPGPKLTALAGLLGGLGAGVLWAMFGPRREGPIAPSVPPAETVVAPSPVAPSPVMPSPVAPSPVAVTAVDPAPECPPATVSDAPSPEPSPEPAPLSTPTPGAEPVPAPAEPEPVAIAPVETVASTSVVPPARPDAEPAVPEAPPATLRASSPVPATALAEPASAGVENTAPSRPSERRHDPARRLRRMLRVLNDHDVPLVADLTRTGVTEADALAPFAATLVSHLAHGPGLTVGVIGVDAAEPPTDLAESLARTIADQGYVVALQEAGEPVVEEPSDLVVEILPPDAPVPANGEHLFVLIVAEATRAAEERLEPLLEIWERDPDRVVVATFAPPPRVAETD